MALMLRFRCPWTGPGVVGPALSTFYAVDPASANSYVQYIKGFFMKAAPLMPPSVTISFPTEGEIIESDTGQINGVWGGAAATDPVVGSGPAAYAAGVGLRVHWATGAIKNGRRVKGATYIVPVSSSYYSSSGAVADATLAELRNGIATFVGSGNWCTFSRPSKKLGPGAAVGIVGGGVPSQVSWLRSRRT